ncbi:hypothetical protein HMPREF9065_00817 [Aggregatibacter sp. oral taxon 458 str. W10330]|nr:hypothetical protein HMPREF9065_00817 [Aggregatibacter sp. oral taxon 458 str. W10330]
MHNSGSVHLDARPNHARNVILSFSDIHDFVQPENPPHFAYKKDANHASF